MKRIDGWLIDSFGSIRGTVVSDTGEPLREIRTSRVVMREHNIVTTKNGSHYELLEPSAIHMHQDILDMWFDGAANPFEAIDYRILNHD